MAKKYNHVNTNNRKSKLRGKYFTFVQQKEEEEEQQQQQQQQQQQLQQLPCHVTSYVLQ